MSVTGPETPLRANGSPIWISEGDVDQLFTLDDAIDALAGAYRLQARGEAGNMRRTHVREGESIHHAVGGVIAGLGVTGTKTWTFTPGGASPLVVVFSLSDGSVLGIVEAFTLGQMRTAATSALGTRVLARPDASVLAMVGTGRQALMQARAVLAVRPIEQIRVYGRNPENRAKMAARLAAETGREVSEHESVAAATHGADVVTAVTRSAEPVLTGEMLDPGTHVNAVGAVVASRRELDETAVGRCSLVVADSLPQAEDDAGELLRARDAGLLDWGVVHGLETVVDMEPEQLRSESDITLFKALGVGLSDVALAAEILRRARTEQLGAPIPTKPSSHV